MKRVQSFIYLTQLTFTDRWVYPSLHIDFKVTKQLLIKSLAVYWNKYLKHPGRSKILLTTGGNGRKRRHMEADPQLPLQPLLLKPSPANPQRQNTPKEGAAASATAWQHFHKTLHTRETRGALFYFGEFVILRESTRFWKYQGSTGGQAFWRGGVERW